MLSQAVCSAREQNRYEFRVHRAHRLVLGEMGRRREEGGMREKKWKDEGGKRKVRRKKRKEVKDGASIITH